MKSTCRFLCGFLVAVSLILSVNAQSATTSTVARSPQVIELSCAPGGDTGQQLFSVWNGGGPDILSYSIGNNTAAPNDDTKSYVIDYSPAGTNWIDTIVALGGSSADISVKNSHTISFATKTLAAGNYSATIYIVNNDSLEQNAQTAKWAYTDVKTVIINLKVGYPILSLHEDIPPVPGDVNMLPVINGREMGSMPAIEHHVAYRGDGQPPPAVPGGTPIALALPPLPYTFPVYNTGAVPMNVGVSVSFDTGGFGGSVVYSVEGPGIIAPGASGNVTLVFHDPNLLPTACKGSMWFPPTGTYTGTITLTGTNVTDQSPAHGSPKTIKIVMRVGPVASVDTWTMVPLSGRTGMWVGNGPCLVPVAGYARDDQQPTDAFTVALDAATPWTTTNVNNAGIPPGSVVADGATNSNLLRYSISRGGELNGDWIKAEVRGAGAQFTTLPLPGNGSWVDVSYDTTNLPVYPPTNAAQPGIKVYNGYIYVRGNDYFGNNSANYQLDENAPIDVLGNGTYVAITLTVRGPTIATDYNSFSQTIVQGSNPNKQTFQIWNMYNVSKLHYSVNVEGAVLPDGTKWMEVADSDPNLDSMSEADKNTVTLTYNASSLATGTYTATITYTDLNATNTDYKVAVTLRVIGPEVATDKIVLNPVCVIGANAVNDTQFYVWNSDEAGQPPGYQGSTLQYSILTSVTTGNQWFTCDPVEGTSTGPADRHLIKVSYLTSALSSGTYNGKINVYNVNDGTGVTIDVNLIVKAPAIGVGQLTFSQKCDVGTNAGTQSFQLWNAGPTDTVLSYTASDDMDWLTLQDSDPTHVSTGPADKSTISLIYNTSTMPAGVYTGKITIVDPKATNNPVEILVTLEIQAPSIALNKTLLFPTCLEGFNAVPTTFQVWNSGFATLNYTITSSVDWITCAPMTGDSANVNDKDTINVAYNTELLLPGTYSGTITISDPLASNNPQVIEVTLVVQKPELMVNKNEITAVSDVGLNASPQAFEVWNVASGGGTITFTVTEVIPQGWLAINPAGGTTSGEHDQITCTFGNAGLPAGLYQTDIEVNGINDKGQVVIGSPQVIHVVLSIGSKVTTNVTEINAECNEGTDAPQQTFTVKNGGVGLLKYTITDDSGGWLSCAPAAGQSTGENDTITVTFVTANLPSGEYTATISVENDDTHDVTAIPVTLKVKSGALVSISTTQIDISCAQGTDAGDATFDVWNSGTGVLNYTITAGNYNPAGNWISGIVPDSGTSTGETDIITLSFATSALDVGLYSADITVADPAAGNSPKTITVSLTILGPTIAADPNTISTACAMGQDAPATTFEVRNSGGGTLTYDIASDVAWISVDPNSGTSSGEHDTINVTFPTSGLAPGTHNGNITITAVGATNTPFVIPVVVSVGQPEIALSTNSLAPSALEGTDADPQTFQIWNAGNGTLTFTITDDVGWLSCDPAAGTSTDVGDKKTINVTYSTAAMAIGTYPATITITDLNASNSPRIIDVTLTVSREVPGENLLIHIAADEEGISKNATYNTVSFWPNQAGEGGASQDSSSISKQPIFTENAIGAKPAMLFSSTVSMIFPNNPNVPNNINTGGPFSEKTIGVVFTTGSDISTKQVIFAQGSSKRGLNIYVQNGRLYLGVWNTSSDGPASSWGPKFVSAGLFPNQTYFAELVFDYPNSQLQGYLNGTLFETVAGIGKIYDDSQGAVLGNTTPQSNFADGKKSGAKGFGGLIAELVYYGAVLDEATRLDLEANLIGKYGITDPPFTADNLVLWLRGDSKVDMDTANLVKTWTDIMSSARSAVYMKQSSAKKKPLFVLDDINNNPGIRFDGLASYMACSSNVLINSDKNSYPEKTIFVVFQTGTNVANQQMIWTQGDNKAGLNIFIQNSNIYVGAWGIKAPNGQNPWGPVFLSRAGLLANTTYCVQLTFDQPSMNFTGSINGLTMGSSAAIGLLYKHTAGALGAVSSTSNINGTWVKKGEFFGGDIPEILMYNGVLTALQTDQVEAYISGRYNINFP